MSDLAETIAKLVEAKLHGGQQSPARIEAIRAIVQRELDNDRLYRRDVE